MADPKPSDPLPAGFPAADAPPRAAPRVSVVIPTFGRAAVLVRGLETLLAQDFAKADYEIVVVDDGSPDDTAARVETLARATPAPAIRLVRQDNRGPAAARNRGAREARGELLLFTDDDCEPTPDWIREMTRPFGDPAARVAAVKGAYATRQTSLVARFAQVEFETRYRRMLGRESVDFVDTYSAAFRRDVFLALGGFDTRFPLANNEDVEFSYRMAARGHRMVFNPRAVVYHRHPDTLRRYLKMKFGRAYWRMAVYRAFPEKMRTDSYTPQSLKAQIALSLLLLALAAAGLRWRALWPYAGLALAVFALTTLPFLAVALDLPALNRALERWTLGWRACFPEGVVRGAVGALRRGPLAPWFRARALALRRVAAAGLRVLRAALRSPPLVAGARACARLAGAAARAAARGAAAAVRLGVLGPVRLARRAARGLAAAGAWAWNSPPLAAGRRALGRVLGTRLGLAAVSLLLLLGRGLVMAFGAVWGLLSRHRARGRFSLVVMLLASDVAAFVAACFAADLATDGLYRAFAPAAMLRVANHMRLVPLLAVLVLAVFMLTGLYRPGRGFSRVNEFVLLAKGLFTSALIVVLVLYLADAGFSKTAVALTFLFALVLLPSGRALARAVHARLANGDGAAEVRTRVLIVGTGEIPRMIARKLRRLFGAETDLVGFVALAPPPPGTMIDRVPVFGGADRLSETIEERRVEEVFVALPQLLHEEVMALVSRHSRREGVHFHIVSNVFDLVGAEVDVAEQTSLPMTYLHNENLALLQLLAKRVFDVVVSLLAILLTLPFWLLAILAIRLETGGPAFFRQERVGKDGRVFRIWKFRTMYADTARFEYSPSAPGDRRVTRVGRFLRRTSLDEFPQFLNVLRGEMSVVGPRPEMPFIVEKYSDWQRLRLRVRPGITGLWQIMGRKDLPLHESLEYDFYYIKNQSLLLDLNILLKTIPVVLRGRGAY